MGADKSINDRLKDADERIRQGRIREAAALIEPIAAADISRGQSLRLAGLLRRVGLSEQAIVLLAPFVRPRKALAAPATAAEKAEYAICLQRIGSLNEAEQLLTEVNPSEAPEALLYRSILRFSVWDYKGAIPSLEALIASGSADAYLLQAARLNLAAALTTDGQYERAGEILTGVLRSTLERKEWLLHGNALEVLSQGQILGGKFDEAKDTLEKAGELVAGIKVIDKLYLIKWGALLTAFKENSLEPLGAAREEARLKRHYETLRDLDFYSLKLKYNRDLHFKLHFGSASSFFRGRLAAHFPAAHLPEEAVLHESGVYREKSGPSLNPLDQKGELAPGTVAHALTMALLSDAYKPFRAGELHSLIFPGDFFNPDTSLNRIHQAVRRTRNALAASLPALTISGDNKAYSLQIGQLEQPILCSPMFENFSPAAIRYQIFKKSLSDERFQSEQVQNAFGLSKSAANKLIGSWRHLGYVELDSVEKSRSYLALNYKA